MDRSYKAADTVTVYQSAKTENALDVFSQQPYSMNGYENYKYKGIMYPGYVDGSGNTYILLSQPLFKV